MNNQKNNSLIDSGLPRSSCLTARNDGSPTPTLPKGEGEVPLLWRGRGGHVSRHCEERSNPENHNNQINHKNQSSDKIVIKEISNIKKLKKCQHYFII